MAAQDGLYSPERRTLRENGSKFSLRSLIGGNGSGGSSNASSITPPASSSGSSDGRSGYYRYHSSPSLPGSQLPSPPTSPLSHLSGHGSGSALGPTTHSKFRGRGDPPARPLPSPSLVGPDAFLPPLVPTPPMTARSMGSFCNVDESVRGVVTGKAAQLLGEQVVPSGKAAKVLGMEKKVSYKKPRGAGRGRTIQVGEDRSTSGDESDDSIHVTLPRRAPPPPALDLETQRDVLQPLEARARPESGSWTVTSAQAGIWELPPDFHTISEADAPPSPASFQFPVSAYFEDSPIDVTNIEARPRSSGRKSDGRSSNSEPKTPPRNHRSPPASASPTAQYATRQRSASNLNRRNTGASIASPGTRRVQRGNALQLLEGVRHEPARTIPLPILPPPPRRVPRLPPNASNSNDTDRYIAGVSFLNCSDSDSDGGEGEPVMLTPHPRRSSKATGTEVKLDQRRSLAPTLSSTPPREATAATQEPRGPAVSPLTFSPARPSWAQNGSPVRTLASPILLRDERPPYVDSSTSDSEFDDEEQDITDSFPAPPVDLFSVAGL